MKNSLLSLKALALLSLLAACSPESNTLVTTPPIENPPDIRRTETIPELKKTTIPPAPKDWITEDGGQKQMEYNPQVDILFVIDNSDSMRATEANLVRNIDRFADGIVRNKVDYHIGAISTWDNSERFINTKKDSYQIGDLRFVKDAKGQTSDKRFITPKESKSLLASTLKIGVASYAEGGPEVEEFFSPLAAALDKSGRGGTNEGFFREDAQLVVVFVTDADDSTSQLTPEQMASKLREFKGQRTNKVSVYGALVRSSDKDEYKDWALRVHPTYHPECFDMTKKTPKNNGTCAEGFGPERLQQLIVLANSGEGSPAVVLKNHTMAITSKNFGSDLAAIGANITEKTLKKEILLSQRPKSDDNGLPMIRVRYGSPEDLAAGKGELIPLGKKGGWLYDPVNNSVLLGGDIKAYETARPGYRFAVDLVPVTLREQASF